MDQLKSFTFLPVDSARLGHKEPQVDTHRVRTKEGGHQESIWLALEVPRIDVAQGPGTLDEILIGMSRMEAWALRQRLQDQLLAGASFVDASLWGASSEEELKEPKKESGDGWYKGFYR